MKNAKWFRDKYHNDPEWHKQKDARNREWRKKYVIKLRAKRDEVFGVKCKICSSIIRLCLHRKDGKKHYMNETQLAQALKHPEEWIRLCGKCHDGIHWVMQYFNLSWSEIESLL